MNFILGKPESIPFAAKFHMPHASSLGSRAKAKTPLKYTN
jgi:hypothetical protein